MNTNFNFKKFKPISIVFILVIGIFASFSLLGNYLASSGKLLEAVWDCGNNIVLNLDKNNSFKMYDSANNNYLDVTGTYKLEKQKQEESTLKYILDMNAKERTVSNQKYTDEYDTQYLISMDSSNQNSIHMVNTVSYGTYDCKKIK